MSGTTALIFGNQLYADHPALPHADQVLMVESAAKLRSRPYHAQKLIFILSAMRHYAERLRERGHAVDYQQAPTFREGLAAHLATHRPDRLIVVAPPDYAADLAVRRHAERLQGAGVHVEIIADTVGFTCPRDDFRAWAAGKKSLLLEHFYRWNRGRLGVLMDGRQPLGGRWNFDAENRLGAAGMPPAPPIPAPTVDALTHAVIDSVRRDYPSAFGRAEPFRWPVTHAEAESWFAAFLAERLPNFGPYEDAMHADDPFLYHSAISALLNVGLLTPLAVVRAAEAAYHAHDLPLQSVEGFVRQVIGWREFVHGVYWLHMPAYRAQNFFQHARPLPEFFWTGETPMRCLSRTVQDVQHHAYSHHIPRLMLLANFGNLAELDPVALTEWFLSVYIDAYDWVMWPNVLGLGLYADGGVLATKPYIAGGAYIKKMSTGYCSACAYRPDQRTGAAACPFTTLYWAFLDRHAARLRGNNRMAIPLKGAADRADMPEIRARAAELYREWFGPMPPTP
jgi:deoxyribodipyrimidine photolyase-related protein